MASVLTLKTIQQRELFPLPFCECFTSPLIHNSLFSHQYFAFPSPKHTFNPSLSSFFTVRNHAGKNLSAVFSTLNHNSSLETLNLRNGEGILGNFNGKDEKFSEEGVNVRKSRKRFDLGEGNEKGSGNSSLETVNLRNGSKISSGSVGERVNKGGEEYMKRRSGGERFNLGKGNESSSSDRRVGFDSGRKWENVKNGDSGGGREYGFENYGIVWKTSEMGSDDSSLSDERERERNYGGDGWGRESVSKNYRETWKRSEMGDVISRLDLGGGKGVRRMERVSGRDVRDNGSKGQKGNGVYLRRSKDDKKVHGSRGQKGNGVYLRRSKDDKKVHGQIIQDNDDGSKVKRKERLSEKNTYNAAEYQLKIRLDMCSKMGDVMSAISLYDSAVKQGIKMGQHQYTVLLYLCSSAAMGIIWRGKRESKSRCFDRAGSNDLDGQSDSEEEDEDTDDLGDEGLGVKDQNEKLETNEIMVSDDVKKYALERGFEVYEKMCFDEVQMNEAALTSVARMAMAMGNGDMAFDMVKQMKSMGISPKLRSYGPALSVFSSNGEVEKAFAVEKHMLENGVHPEEPELEALLNVSIQSGKADRVYYVLHKLRTNVRSVSPSTAELIEKWFRSREASRVGKRKWDKTMLAQTIKNVGGGWHGQGWLGSGTWNESSSSDVGFDSGRKWENVKNGDSGRGREYGFENYGIVWKTSEMGSDDSSLSDERERERNYGGGGWGREYVSKNYRETWKRSEMGDGISRLDLGGGKGVRRMERVSGRDVRDNGSRGQKGNGVYLRRSKDDKKVHGQIIQDNDDGSKVKRKERLSEKNTYNSAEFQLKIRLDMCSKMGDVMSAISLYDSAVKQGIKMGQRQYTVLLYLCSSAAMGVIWRGKRGYKSRCFDRAGSNDLDGQSDSEEEDEDTDDLGDEDLGVKDQNEKLETNEIMVSDDVKKYALERGFEVYEKMCFDEVQMNEAALTSVARMAMAMGNGDMAFDMVKQMKSMGISPKLRSYGPALSVFSSNGEVEKAFAVEKHMLENGVHPEEPELEALLNVSIQSGKADRVYHVLHKLRTNVRSVSPSTAELIEKWFRSREASRVGKRKWDKTMLAQTIENVGGGWHGQGWLGNGKWTVSRTSIGGDGLCRCCGEKLSWIDLDPEETERFAESVASIAIKKDRNSSFQMFQRWLDYYGPFEAVVDAANVGLLGQRKFKPSKVNAVVNGIRQLLPSKKWPLIILHNKRVTGSMMGEPFNKAVVEKWKIADALYATPTGSNDDWYWLYAAIKSKCLLVTNDEMRDHTFKLLRNDFFPKWKERHQVRFSFSEIGPVFHMPPTCSVVIQESDRGFWHIPIASEHQSEGDRIWLCISRPKLLVKQQDPIAEVDPGESNSRT